MHRRACYCGIVPCTLLIPPLSYALKTWKDRKEQFTTRNKTLTDTSACMQKAEVVQKGSLLFSGPDVYQGVPPLCSPCFLFPSLSGLLHIVPFLSPPPFPFLFLTPKNSFHLLLSWGSNEGFGFPHIMYKEKLSLPGQPQSETLTGQINLLYVILTTSESLTLNVCPSHPRWLSVLLAYRRRVQRGELLRVPPCSGRAGQGRCLIRL